MTVGFRDLLALNVHSMAPLIAADAALAIVGAALFASLGEESQAVVGVVVMFATFMLFIFVNTVFKVRDFGSLSYTTGWRVFAITAVRRRDLVNSRNVASAIVFVPQAVAGAVLMIAGYMLPGSAMVACACMGVMAAVFQNAWLLNGGSIYRSIRDNDFLGLGYSYGQHRGHVTAFVSIVCGGLLLLALILGAMLSYTFEWDQPVTVLVFVSVAFIAGAVVTDLYTVRFYERVDQRGPMGSGIPSPPCYRLPAVRIRCSADRE